MMGSRSRTETCAQFSSALMGVLIAMLVQSALSAQQPGSSRLVAYGTTSWTILGWTAANHSLFEVDPGGGGGTPIPISQQPGAFNSWIVESAYDPIGGRIFVFNLGLGPGPWGTLLTIDSATGIVLSSSSPSQALRNLEYETSTGRLLAISNAFPPPSNVQGLFAVDPATANKTLILLLPALVPAWPVRGITAIDPATNRFFLLHLAPTLQLTPMMAVIDTLSGTVISDFTTAGYWFIQFDTSTNQLYGLVNTGGFPGNNPSGLVTVDTATGLHTPIGTGHPLIQVGSIQGQGAAALDQQRGLFYLMGLQLSGFRLFTFDITTGDLLADPPVFNDNPYLTLEVDIAATPLNGRVTPASNNRLVPGSTLGLTFDAATHAGEFYIPFVSCTPGSIPFNSLGTGSFPIPGSNLSIPLVFDVCSNFYFYDPFSSAFFNLTPTGSIAGVLSGGVSPGAVTLPAATPPGLNFDLYITFLTLTTSLQWTGVHGMAILHVSS